MTQITIFYSYADQDEKWLGELQKRLKPLRLREGVTITDLHHGTILPGSESEGKLREYLDRAQIIFLLISPDFMAEHYESPEVQRILELKFDKMGPSPIRIKKTPHVIPILVRDTYWKDSLFFRLESLPAGSPIDKWENLDTAFRQVVYKIDGVIQDFNPLSDVIPSDSPQEAEQIYQSKIPPENPFFTGREDLLMQIRDKLTRQKTTALTHRQAIYGLGGIGKTQLAVKYVYCYGKDYKQVLWVNADTREILIEGYVEIAQDLKLSERNEKNQSETVEALKRWLETHMDWLLVLDNADDLEMVQEFIPSTINGHLLLTTRAQALGEIAESIEIERMSIEDGTLFLLRRAKKIPIDGSMKDASRIDWQNAEKIVQELGSLPLALDQAGAYIEETKEGLGPYLQLYLGEGVKLLQKRSKLSRSHPASVITTFLLAFEKVEQFNPAAANVLQLCAFLAPDAIPESLLTEYLSATTVGINPLVSQRQGGRPRRFPFSLPSLRQFRAIPQAPSPTEIRSMLNNTSEALLKFSLIHRDDRNSTLAVHRLVQAVLRDDMDENTQRQWAERAVCIVNTAFPAVGLHKVEVKTWPDCEKLLPHVLACAPLIKKYQITLPEASRLLNDAATYLIERAQYREAEPLAQQSVLIRKAEERLLYAQSLHNLGTIYVRQAKYNGAEQCLREALKFREQALSENHPDVAVSLHSLAELYDIQGRPDKAEPFYERALKINQLNFESEHSYIAQYFDSLITFYLKQKMYDKAEDLYKSSVEISEEKLGKDNPRTAEILYGWGQFCRDQGKVSEAEGLHTRALAIRKKVFGLKNPVTATSLNSIAELYEIQGKGEDAEKLYKQSWSIREEVLGRDHPDTAASIYSLAKLYRGQGKVKEAEPLYKQALSIREKRLGLNHSLTLENQRELADLYKSQQRLVEAERLYKRGLGSRYRKLRPDDPAIIQNLQDLVELYKLLDKSEEIERLYEDAFEQRSSRLGINHPSTEQCLRDLQKLYKSQNKSDKALQLYEKTFDMRVQKIRGDDPNSLVRFEESLKDISDIYDNENKIKEKESIYVKACRMCANVLGRTDSLTKRLLDKVIKISESQDKSEVVEQLYKESLEAHTLALTKDLPDTLYPFIQTLEDVAGYYEKQHKFEEGEKMYEQGLITSYQKLGLDHPRTIQIRHDLAKLYERHGKAEEAERIYREALEICKKKLEFGSPRIIEACNDLASCYLRHNKSAKATPLIEEMLRFCEPMVNEQPFPKDYTLAIVHSLANAASLYQMRYKQHRERGEEWFKQALKISEEKLGKDHQDTVNIRNRYVAFLRDMRRYDEAAAVEINPITMKEADNNNEENEQSPVVDNETETHEEDL